MVITMMLLPRVRDGMVGAQEFESSSCSSALVRRRSDQRRPDLLGAALHAAATLDQLAEIYRYRPVASGSKVLTQLAGTGGMKTCSPSLTALSPNVYASCSVRNQASGNSSAQQL